MFSMPFFAIEIAKNQGSLVIFPNATGLLYRLAQIPLELQLDPDQYLADHPELQPVAQLIVNKNGLLFPIALDKSTEYQRVFERFSHLKTAKITQLFNQRFLSLELAIAAISSALSSNGKQAIPDQLHAYYTLVGHQNACQQQVRELLRIDERLFNSIPDRTIDQPAIEITATPIHQLTSKTTPISRGRKNAKKAS